MTSQDMMYYEMTLKLDRIERMLFTLLSEEEKEKFRQENIKYLESQINKNKIKLETLEGGGEWVRFI